MYRTGGTVTVGGARHPAVAYLASGIASEFRNRVDLSRSGAVRDFLATPDTVTAEGVPGAMGFAIEAVLYAGAYAAAAAWLDEFAGRIGDAVHVEDVRLRDSAVNVLQGRTEPGEIERRGRPRPFEESAVPCGKMAAAMLGGGGPIALARELAAEDWRATLDRLVRDAERLEARPEIGAGAADCITLAAAYLATAAVAEARPPAPFFRDGPDGRRQWIPRDPLGGPAAPSRDAKVDPPAPLGVFQIRNAGSAPDSPPEKIEAPHVMRAAELFMEQTETPATPALSVVYVLDPFEQVFRLEVENRAGFWTANAPVYHGRRGVENAEGWSWLS